MNRSNAKALDWVHPSWRDLVIEHLTHRPQDRQRFLSRCGIVGLELALSGAGGRAGERSQPLLQTPDDWTTLRRRALELINEADQAGHRRLLSTIRSLMLTAADGGTSDPLHELARDVLPAIAAAWNASGEPIRTEGLKLFYDVSVQVRPLVAGPALEATWEASARSLGDPAGVEAPHDASPVLDLIEVIAANEPRLLRQCGWPVRFAVFGDAVEARARAQLDESAVLLKAIDEPDFDSVSTASEASLDLYLWIEVLDNVKELMGRRVDETHAALSAAMSKLDGAVERFEEREADLAEMEREYADDDGDDDGSAEDPAEQLQGIFVDL